jgi:MFS family permease
VTEHGVPVVTSPRLGHQTLSRRITAVYGVIAVFFVHGMLFASWVAHIPQVKAHLDIGLGLLGVALLGAPIGSILAMSAAGYMVPRLGSRRVLRTGMIGYCLAGALLGVAGDGNRRGAQRGWWCPTPAARGPRGGGVVVATASLGERQRGRR